MLNEKGKFHTRTSQEGPKEEYMYSSTLSLTPALDGVDVNATSLALYPRGMRPGTHGWVGLRAALDWRGKSRLHKDSIPGPSSP